jgi:hypothetical protein
MNRQVIGRTITAIPVAFLAFDAVIKLMNIEAVQQSFQRLGYQTSIALAIGLLELACLVVYVVPRTSVFGAVLLTGFLGGAIATHARVGDPLLTHSLFPVYVAILLWTGLFLRSERLRTFVRAAA